MKGYKLGICIEIGSPDGAKYHLGFFLQIGSRYAA